MSRDAGESPRPVPCSLSKAAAWSERDASARSDPALLGRSRIAPSGARPARGETPRRDPAPAREMQMRPQRRIASHCWEFVRPGPPSPCQPVVNGCGVETASALGSEPRTPGSPDPRVWRDPGRPRGGVKGHWLWAGPSSVAPAVMNASKASAHSPQGGFLSAPCLSQPLGPLPLCPGVAVGTC